MPGKLSPRFFPAIFGPNRDQPLDVEAVRVRFEAMAREVGDGRSPEQIADGFIQITVASMAEAIKKISIQRGHDITRYVLNSFDGAGGQHACLVADALGMKTVLTHPFSGLLSVYGMGMAEVRSSRQCSLDVPLDDHAASAIPASHRREHPFGVDGGEPGELGKTLVHSNSGLTEELQPCDQTVPEAGEAVTVITPTGGEYGAGGG